jgi:transposase
MTRDVKMDAPLGASSEGFAGRIDVIAGPTGRRNRSESEKRRIAAESLAPGAVVADVARQHGATRWQIYDWRRRFRRERLEAPSAEIAAAPAFVPLTVDEAMPEPGADFIEVAIGDVLIRVGPGVSEAHLARIFRAVRAAT